MQSMYRLVLTASLGWLIAGCDGGTAQVLEPTTKNFDAWPVLESPIERDPEIEAQIDELLAQMSVEQKVGQLIQAEIRWVDADDVREYHLGSVLNGGGSHPDENKYASVDDWVALADEFYDASMNTDEGRLAIPVLWGTDSVHGLNNVIGATLFPHNIGLGATRNTDLIRRIGEITAIETAVIGIPWTFAPTVAVARDDRWGRTYESYAENPDIVRAYAGAVVEGLQGPLGSDTRLDDSRVLATAKHFLGDGGTTDGIDQGDNPASETELFEIHGQGYVSALAAGVRTIMASYSSSRGLKMHGNRYLLTEILKERMGFDGFVVGDWDGHSQVPGCTRRSCAAAINAGIDLVMVPRDWKRFYKNTVKQVRRGDITPTRLDDAVRRVLRVKFEAGLFDAGAPSSRRYAGQTEYLGAPAHRAVARQAVRESLVLLKNNNGVLPLARNQRVLVAGTGANDIARQSGGWTLTWQGTDNDNDDFPGATSIFTGIEEAVSTSGGSATLSVDGTYSQPPEVAIVVFGEAPYAECRGDLGHLNYDALYPEDLQLLEKFQADRIPVISVFLSGRPLWINPHLNASDAFVAAWLPGSEGGAVADVLFRTRSGDINHDFRGKLSFSWPAYGYGLTYADDKTLPELPTDIGAAKYAQPDSRARDSCVDD